MTSFNEGDINRAADGKFAAKQTGEADFNAFFDQLRDTRDEDFEAERRRRNSDDIQAQMTLDAYEQADYHYDHGFDGLSDISEVDHREQSELDDLDTLYEYSDVDSYQYAIGQLAVMDQAKKRRSELANATPDERADVPAGYQIGDSTPFGPVVARREIAAGLAYVETDRSGDGIQQHTGYVLSERRQKMMGALAKTDRFYEGDYDATFVAMRFPRDMHVSQNEVRQMEGSLRRSDPDRFTAYMTEKAALPDTAKDALPDANNNKERSIGFTRQSLHNAQTDAVEARLRYDAMLDPRAEERHQAMSNLERRRRDVLIQAYGETFTIEQADHAAALSDDEAKRLFEEARFRQLSAADVEKPGTLNA